MTIALGSRLIQRAKLFVPWVGRWVLEVHFDGAPPTGKVTVQWGRTALTGTVLPGKSGSVVGQGVATIVGGAGWHQVPPSTWLIDTMAAPLRVASQLSSAVGETLIAQVGAIREGRSAFARSEQAASITLESLLAKGALWWVEYGGTTRVALGRSAPAFDPAKVLRYDPAARVAQLDIEEPSEAPIGAEIPADGEHFETAQRIRELRMEADETGVRATVSFELPTTSAPRLASLLEVASRQSKPAPHATIRAATVQPQQDAQRRVSLRFEERDGEQADPLPVPLWAGLPGASAELFSGTRVLVAFDRADPTNPIAMLSSPFGQPGHVPKKVWLEAHELLQIFAGSAGTLKVGPITSAVALAPSLVVYLQALEAYLLALDGPLLALIGPSLTPLIAARTAAAENFGQISATRLEAE